MMASSPSSSADLLAPESVPDELTSIVAHGNGDGSGVDAGAALAGAGLAGAGTYGATDEVNGGSDEVQPDEGKAKKKGKKGLRAGQKAVADALKTDMAAERTFFKWLWTGLHTGAIGSFIFVTFDGDRQDPMRLVVVGFSWLVALCLVLYGVFAYYRRRKALRTGDITVIPTFTREHSPVVVVAALAMVVGAALLYAATSHSRPPSDQSAQHAAGAGVGAV